MPNNVTKSNRQHSQKAFTVIPVTSRQSPKHSWWELPLIMLLGASIGLLILGIVVVSHGAALPVMAGIGGAVLLGHGSAGAALGVGLGIFGAASALVGAGVGFAAKITENLFGRLFKGKAQTTVNKPAEVSSSTTSALRGKLGSRLSSPARVPYVAQVLADANDGVPESLMTNEKAATESQHSLSPRRV